MHVPMILIAVLVVVMRESVSVQMTAQTIHVVMVPWILGRNVMTIILLVEIDVQVSVSLKLRGVI